MTRRIRFRVWLAGKILPPGYGPCVTVRRSFRAGLEDPHPEIVRTEVREPAALRDRKADAPRVRDVL